MAEDEEETAEAEPENTPDENEGETGPSRTITFSVNTIIIGVFALGLAVGFSGGVLASGDGGILTFSTTTGDNPDTGTDTGQPSDTGNQQQQDTVDMSNIELEGEPVLGQEDAPVTMVMYEDFECPFCKRFEEGAFTQIKENYIDTGQVKAVWKDFPLTQLHPWAKPGAAAMECVYREGGNDAFWPVKNKVFANQNSVSTDNVESQIKTWASEEGVSESAVQSCLDNQNPLEEVNADQQEGRNLGVSGTPTVFVDGRKIVGAQPYSNFQSAIESALS